MPAKKYFTDEAKHEAHHQQMRQWRQDHREERAQYRAHSNGLTYRQRTERPSGSPPIHQCITVLRPHLQGSIAFSLLGMWTF